MDNVKEPTFRTMSFKDFSTLDVGASKIVDSYGVAMTRDATTHEEGMTKFASFRQGMMQDPYPSPFLNLSDTHIPNRMSDLFELCRYFYMFDPLIAGAINSLATFPVTNVFLDESKIAQKAKKDGDKNDSDQLKTYKKALFENINLNKLLIEIGIDYWLYGNCFIFGEFWENPDTKQKEWRHVVRLDPSRMIIDHNEATREIKYKWMVPEKIRRIVTTKKPRAEYNKIPDLVKQAVEKSEAVVINPNNIYHFARPSDSMGDTIWGTPVIANVMKLLMYRNVLRQAQEAIAREHIVPFRVYYFERTQQYDPTVDWNNVTTAFAAELNRSAKDPNYKVISPLPVNVLNLGGDGRALMLTPEIEQVQAEILAGMNVPREFIFGGVTWSGSSISLKILENQFITYRLLMQDMLNFLVKNMAKIRKEWRSEADNDALPTIHMQELKMQDDAQQKQLIINLNGAGKITDELLLKTMDIDPEKMASALESEMKKKIETDKNIQIEKLKANVDVQKADLNCQVDFLRYREKVKQALLNSGDPIDIAVAQQLFGAGMPAGPDGQPMMDGPGGPGDPNAPQGGPAGGPGAAGGGPVGPQGAQAQMTPSVPMNNPQDTPDAPSVPDKKSQADKKDGGNNADVKDEDAALKQLASMPPEQRAAAIAHLPPAEQKALAARVNSYGDRKDYGTGYGDAEKLAKQIMDMPEGKRKAALDSLSPRVKNRVEVFMESMMNEQEKQNKKLNDQKGGGAVRAVDMRALPTQKPPRRDSLS